MGEQASKKRASSLKQGLVPTREGFHPDPRIPSTLELEHAFKDSALLSPTAKAAVFGQGKFTPTFDNSYGKVLVKKTRSKSGLEKAKAEAEAEAKAGEKGAMGRKSLDPTSKSPDKDIPVIRLNEDKKKKDQKLKEAKLKEAKRMSKAKELAAKIKAADSKTGKDAKQKGKGRDSVTATEHVKKPKGTDSKLKQEDEKTAKDADADLKPGKGAKKKAKETDLMQGKEPTDELQDEPTGSKLEKEVTKKAKLKDLKQKKEQSQKRVQTDSSVPKDKSGKEPRRLSLFFKDTTLPKIDKFIEQCTKTIAQERKAAIAKEEHKQKEMSQAAFKLAKLKARELNRAEIYQPPSDGEWCLEGESTDTSGSLPRPRRRASVQGSGQEDRQAPGDFSAQEEKAEMSETAKEPEGAETPEKAEQPEDAEMPKEAEKTKEEVAEKAKTSLPVLHQSSVKVA